MEKNTLWPVPAAAAARGQEVLTFPSSKVLTRRLTINEKTKQMGDIVVTTPATLTLLLQGSHLSLQWSAGEGRKEGKEGKALS
jgi:hypothetical protein